MAAIVCTITVLDRVNDPEGSIALAKRKIKGKYVYRHKKTGRFVSKSHPSAKLTKVIHTQKRDRKGRFLPVPKGNYLGQQRVGFDNQLRSIYLIPFTNHQFGKFSLDLDAIQDAIDKEVALDSDVTVLGLAHVSFKDRTKLWYRVTDIIFASEDGAAKHLRSAIMKSVVGSAVKRILEVHIQFTRREHKVDKPTKRKRKRR